MGHEYTLIIAEPLSKPDPYPTERGELKGRKIQFHAELARVELCKPGYDRAIYKLLHAAQEALFRDKKGIWPYVDHTPATGDGGGEEPILTDLYERPLAPVSVLDALKALSQDELESVEEDGGWPYWRFRVAVDLLRSCQAALDAKQTRGGLVVLAWGH